MAIGWKSCQKKDKSVSVIRYLLSVIRYLLSVICYLSKTLSSPYKIACGRGGQPGM